MTDDRWIIVRRWESFQHRDAARVNVPTWIKTYTQLLSDEAYLSLTFHQRGVLSGLWLEYARARRQLSDNTLTLSRRLGQRVVTRDLEALSDAGFIEFSASKPASRVAGTDASTEERREEEKYPLPREAGTTNNRPIKCKRCGFDVQPRASCAHCGATPRQAGSNLRELSKASPYRRAEAFVMNGGWEYDDHAFNEELSAYDLNDDERLDLSLLRATLHGAPTTDDDRNPLLDD